jgi:hypothetical protein
MTGATLDQIAEALLYEGYLRYPHRTYAVKTRQRFTFGRVYPKAFSAAQKGMEPCVMQTECVVQLGGGPPSVEVSVRFLHLIAREIHALSPPPRELAGREGHTFNLVPELHLKAKQFQSSQEAFERQITPPPLPLHDGKHACKEHGFCFSAGHTVEPIRDEDEPAVGIINRRHEALHGVVEIAAEPAGKNLFKLSVRVLNQTPMQQAQIGNRDAVLMQAFISTHIALHARNAQFVSMTDPPPTCGEAVASCKNSGAWPVLIGDEEKADCTTMLSSPIVLPDYPKISAGSAGNLFDATEIDEMLSLRIITKSDREKGENRQADEHARRLLERTESLQRGDRLKMHGTLRSRADAKETPSLGK